MSIILQSDEIEYFDEIQDNLSYSVGEPNVSIERLMNDRFISENTRFDSWGKLLYAAKITDERDFSTPRFNEFIRAHTRFEEWEEMLVQASNHYVSLTKSNDFGKL